MSKKKKSSPIERLVEARRNTEAIVACIGAFLVVPIVGLVLLFCTEGNLRAIGLGFLVYSFALFVVLPGLVLAANEGPGSGTRLFAAFACFVLAFFTFFYLSYTAPNRQDVKYITTIPITVLGFIFAGWWARDCITYDDSQ